MASKSNGEERSIPPKKTPRGGPDMLQATDLPQRSYSTGVAGWLQKRVLLWRVLAVWGAGGPPSQLMVEQQQKHTYIYIINREVYLELRNSLHRSFQGVLVCCVSGRLAPAGGIVVDLCTIIKTS
jgi:hypothetical protein